MEVQQHEQVEISSLRKTNRVLKYLFICLCLLSVLPLTLVIVYAHKRAVSESQLTARQQILTDLQHDLHNQNFIYEFSGMKISQFVMGFDRNTTLQPVKTMDLSHNQLISYSDNVIPGLKTLILDDNPLSVVANNYLPSLNNVSILTGALEKFTNNSMMGVSSLPINPKIKEFSLNKLSLRTLSLNSRDFRSNILEDLEELQLDCEEETLLSQSHLPNLTSLTFLKAQNYSLANNVFGKLKQMTLNTSEKSFAIAVRDNQFPQMNTLTWTPVLFVAIVNNSFPQLTEFTRTRDPPILAPALSNSTATPTFSAISGNSMPLLTELALGKDAYISDISNNNFSSVKIINCSRCMIFNFTNNSLPSLEQAYLKGNSLHVLEINAPKLKHLDITMNSLASLKLDLPAVEVLLASFCGTLIQPVELRLPSLTRLDVSYNSIHSLLLLDAGELKEANLNFNNITNFTCVCHNLTSLILSLNRLTSFNAGLYPKLTYLDLDHNNLASIQLAGNSLKTLHLSDNNFTSFNASSLGSLELLDLSKNSLSTLDVQSDSLVELSCFSCGLLNINIRKCSNLETLNLGSNLLTEVSNWHLEALQILDLSDNPLEVFSNNQFQSLKTTDNINFLSLTAFQNNQISHFDNKSAPVWLQMTSPKLESFSGNHLVFGNISLRNSTVSLSSISNNTLTVSGGTVSIRSPNLVQFNDNSLNSCNSLLITNTTLTTFSNNILLSVENLNLTNNHLTKLNNNTIKGVKTINLMFNMLDDSVADELVDMKLDGVQVIMIGNNSFVDREEVHRKLVEQYPEAKIVL